jgi:enamine deaminase RidA (YjgF/YER057c/UK114 family)|uniref:Rid family hydrolase n=1 Tax=Eubacterium cellulosolvens TaxID=29322 RepID=UPI000485397E|nr:Rid family hydrolase [[Eubacterium] cellulosolvens]
MGYERKKFGSGAPLEEKVGYSRMVQVGPFIKIGGTTSVQPDGSVYGEDAYEQTKYVLQKQIDFLEKAGASVKDVTSLMIYTTDISAGGKILEAYTEFFHDVKPLCTMVEITRLNRPTQLVEIMVEAVKTDEADA